MGAPGLVASLIGVSPGGGTALGELEKWEQSPW